MSERTHLLVQQWLQQALPQNGFTENLQQLSNTYPYFSAAQLMLFKRSGAEELAERKKIASLHVYNPLFLEIDGLEKMFDFPFEEKAILFEKNDGIIDNTATPEEVLIEDEITTENFSESDKRVLEDFNEDPINEATGLVEIVPEMNEATAENDTAAEKFSAGDQLNAVSEPEFKLPKLNLNAPAADITFEPFHTVDYFASQGIKLNQIDFSNDQFGKQLKSFTEWLKTMKKLPTTAITQNTDGAGERKVESLAAHSLQNTDIITESMAEVWVKQGNLQKASEVYNKLSLQNPSKRAYFAAKIESLKKPS